MTTIFLSRTRHLVAASLMLIDVLLICYSAVANPRRSGTQNGAKMANVAPAERDRDHDCLKKRREFVNRFFGTGSEDVSPSAYMAGVAVARALPSSPLLENRRFTSGETM